MQLSVSIITGLIVAGSTSFAGQTFGAASTQVSANVRAVQSARTERKSWRIDCDEEKHCSYIQKAPAATRPAMSHQARNAELKGSPCVDCTQPGPCNV